MRYKLCYILGHASLFYTSMIFSHVVSQFLHRVFEGRLLGVGSEVASINVTLHPSQKAKSLFRQGVLDLVIIYYKTVSNFPVLECHARSDALAMNTRQKILRGSPGKLFLFLSVSRTM